MPHYCIVPMCTNVSGTPGISFHRLPLKNPVLLKIWLIKIRRENAPVNEHSRICSEHFKDGKKQGKDDIPVVCAWTKPSRPPPKSRHTVTGTDVASEDVEYNAPVEDFYHATASSFIGENVSTQTIRDVSDAETQIYKIIDHIAVQHSPDYDHQSTQTELDTFHREDRSTQTDFSTILEHQLDHQSTQTDVSVNHVGTITDGEVEMPPFSVEQIKDDDETIKFYTGFVTFAHLMACFHFLGPAATNLCYGARKSDTPVPGGRSRCLSPLNGFFLTMCRLRQSLKEQDLLYRFQISQPTVS